MYVITNYTQYYITISPVENLSRCQLKKVSTQNCISPMNVKCVSYTEQNMSGRASEW